MKPNTRMSILATLSLLALIALQPTAVAENFIVDLTTVNVDTFCGSSVVGSVVSAKTTNAVYASVQCGVTALTARLYKSTDNGATWVKVREDAADNRRPLVHATGDTVYHFVFRTPSGEQRVYKSVNAGSTWDAGTVIATEPGMNGFNVALNGNTLRLVADKAGTPVDCVRVTESTDGGATWSAYVTVHSSIYAACSVQANDISIDNGAGISVLTITEHVTTPSKAARLSTLISTDYGATWVRKTVDEITTGITGAPGTVFNNYVHRVDIESTTEFNFCALRVPTGSVSALDTHRMYYTLDAGDTWNAEVLITGTTSVNYKCVVSTVDGNTVMFFGLLSGSGSACDLDAALETAANVHADFLTGRRCDAPRHVIYMPDGSQGIWDQSTTHYRYSSFDMADAIDDENTVEQAIVDLRVDYKNPAGVYTQAEGFSTTFVTDPETGYSELARYDEDLIKQFSSYDSVPCLNAQMRHQAGAYQPLIVSVDSQIVSACTFKGGNDGIGEDGWAWIRYSAGLAYQEEYIQEYDIFVVKSDSRVLNWMFTLTSDNRLWLKDFGASTAPIFVGVTGYAKDCATSKIPPYRVACVGTTGLRTYDTSLVLLSQIPTPGGSIALHGDKLYTADGSVIREYDILSDGSPALNATHSGMSTADRGLRISKDGAYLMLRSATNFRVIDASTQEDFFTSPGFETTYAMDMDVLNRYLFASYQSDSDYKLARFDIADSTSAFGDPENDPPLPAVDPYDNPDQETEFEDTDPGSGGDGGIINDPGEGIFGQAIDYTADSWGLDTTAVGWMFGLTIVGFITFRFWRPGFAGAIIASVLSLTATGACVALGLLPLWLMFALVFLILLLFSKTPFSAGDGEP